MPLLVILALSFSACLSPSCFVTNVSWHEPNFGTWLSTQSAHPRLNASTAPPGLPLGPRIAAALPDGAVIPTVTNVRRVGGFTAVNIILMPDSVIVTVASELENGPAKVSGDTIVGWVGEILDATYRGDAENRTALIAALREAWPDIQRQRFDGDVHFNLSGPRDLDSIFPQDPRLDHDLTGHIKVLAGNWDFSIILPNYAILLDNPDHIAAIDTLGLASFFAISKLSRAQVADEVKAAVPEYSWTFERYRSELNC